MTAMWGTAAGYGGRRDIEQPHDLVLNHVHMSEAYNDERDVVASTADDAELR
ncbi:hypothetical protein GTW69_14490, partial [Streptomyces sp. SID7760]|nr:hypothetical protein [Streptomyces sp. SID7760]